MTDIVKRLREPPFGTETSERNLMSDAADDITRLKAEVERKDAALQKIESGLPAGSTLTDGKHAMWRDAYRELQRITRAALTPTQENENE